MATFTDLPNELVIKIWSHEFEPDEIESFALVSKKVHELGKHFVEEHTRLKRQYLKTSLYPSAAADLLEKMLRNPRIALYVNALTLMFPHCDDQKHARKRYSGEIMELFSSAIQLSPLIAPPDEQDWTAAIRSGDQDSILGFTIMQLPRLKKVEISGSGGVSNYTLLQSSWGTPPSLEGSSPAGPSTVPKVIDSHRTLPRPLMFPNIDELTLDDCVLTFHELSHVLRGIKELKSFGYSEAFFAGPQPFQVQPSQVCDTLLDYSSGSLQKLCFSATDPNGNYLGDLTQFRTLIDLEVDFIPLLGSTGRGLSDRLPASTERVTLRVTDRIVFKSLEEAVRQMTKSIERLPNLKALMVKCENSTGMTFPTELENMFAEIGVHLSVKP